MAHMIKRNEIDIAQADALRSATTAAFDLEACFERIGYAGERTPTLETLRTIHVRHTEAIAFENLNPLLKWPVRLDALSLQQKIVRDGRGGYCFEQNLLLSHALKALGFKVTGLAARVLWNAPEGAITARGHMLLRFDLQEQFLPDYEVTNWYLSNHPSSHFVTGATGKQGGVVTRLLLQKGHKVKAFTRKPDSPAALELKRLGAELAAGSLDELNSIQRAAQGVETIFAKKIGAGRAGRHRRFRDFGN